MTRYLLIAIFTILTISVFAQSKFYIAAETGIRKNMLMNTYNNNYLFNPSKLEFGLKGGYQLTDNLAIETGMSRLNSTLSSNMYIPNPNGVPNDYVSISSNFKMGIYAVPIHLKFKTNIFNDKWSAFAFTGVSYMFGKLKNEMSTSGSSGYGTYGGYGGGYREYVSYEISGGDEPYTYLGNSISEKYHNWSFDAGLGLEYSLNSKLSVYSQLSFSLGNKAKINQAFNELDLMEMYNKPAVINRWKGDRLGLDVGVKYRF